MRTTAKNIHTDMMPATGSMTFESSYTYNEFNQLTGSVEESREDYIRTAYIYDTNGNQISKTTTDAYTNTQTGQTVYTYDAANRLKTATGTTGGNVDYVQENKYNGFGQRVEKKEGSDVTEYFYDGSAVLYTKDGTGTTTSFNLIEAEDNILSTSRKDANGQTDFYVYTKDIRESTTNVIGKNGLSQVSYTYDEHGETTEYQKNEATPFYNEICYTAGVYDATTGLYNLNARYYSPEAGVFLTQDTYRGSRSRTGTLNYYAYCAGNPISYTDPSGHNPVAVILRAASIAFAVAGVYSTYKNAKKKGYSKKKTAVAVAVSAAINFAPVGKVSAVAKVGKASKFTKAAGSAVKTGKVVKNVLSQPKVATTLDKTAQNAVKNATAKKTAQTLGRQQKRVGSSVCFTAGTKIHTKYGFKNIETIKAGDYVWSENPETHEKALKQVKKIFVREKDSIIRLAINGEVIETTAEHPFYVEGKGFTAAGELKAGDEVRLESGEEAFVESTGEIQLSEPVKVYNFEVEDFHTYYVSEQKVLVHNTCSEDITIRNYKYAGSTYHLTGELAKKYPNGVKFNEKGFPDFSKYSIKDVVVENLTGTSRDFAKANKIAGFSTTPKGYTWHHVEDGKTMSLVPRDLHSAVGHTGGVAMIKRGLVP